MLKELARKRIKDFTTLLNCIVVPAVLGSFWLYALWLDAR